MIWAVFFLSCGFPSLDHYGVVPRTASGLIGIPLSIFLHHDIPHLVGNTIPLFILLALLAGSKARSWAIVLYVTLLGGAFLWIAGRTACHIGASGLIFGLIAFLIVSGLLEGLRRAASDLARSRIFLRRNAAYGDSAEHRFQHFLGRPSLRRGRRRVGRLLFDEGAKTIATDR